MRTFSVGIYLALSPWIHDYRLIWTNQMNFHQHALIKYQQSQRLNIPNVGIEISKTQSICIFIFFHSFIIALSKPVRHFIAASSSELTAFISRDGYWNCLNITLGLEAGKSEVIAIDAVESDVDDKISLYVALAVAEVSPPMDDVYSMAQKYS